MFTNFSRPYTCYIKLSFRSAHAAVMTTSAAAAGARGKSGFLILSHYDISSAVCRAACICTAHAVCADLYNCMQTGRASQRSPCICGPTALPRGRASLYSQQRTGLRQATPPTCDRSSRYRHEFSRLLELRRVLRRVAAESLCLRHGSARWKQGLRCELSTDFSLAIARASGKSTSSYPAHFIIFRKEPGPTAERSPPWAHW